MSRPLPHVEGVSHRHVAVDGGLRLHVAEAGPEDPPGGTVVLLHGWPQHWYLWRGVIPALAERHRVVCPDLRGFGWSDAPRGGYDKETLARDVLGLLDALELERVHLAGHDWGGWAGFLLCLHHPERVERFLALNIPHPWQRTGARNVLSMWRHWYQWVLGAPALGPRAAGALAGLGETAVRRLAFDVWDDRTREIFLGQLAEPERARASSELYRSFQLVDLPKVVSGRYRRRRLRTPTLLLFGDADPVIPLHQVQGFEPYADDMRLEVVPGIGHFIVDEVPDLVAERALAHFGAATPARPAASPR